MSNHTPRTAAEIRAALIDAARAAEGASVPDEARWTVIRGMEDAWQEVPGKVRAANRRAVLGWVYGFSSTKQLSDAHIVALAAHLEDFDAWDELRLCLRAALIACGQIEMAIEAGAQDQLDAAKTLQELAQEDHDARKALIALQTEQDNLRREQLRLLEALARGE